MAEAHRVLGPAGGLRERSGFRQPVRGTPRQRQYPARIAASAVWLFGALFEGLIGRELSQCAEKQALGRAIQTLVRTHLGYQRVALWSQPDEGGASELLCVAGTAPAASVHRYVLEHRGRVVGMLELGARRADAGTADEQVLCELLPWIAATLEHLTVATAPVDGKPAVAGLTDRLDRCRHRWRLTPRQSEVLALLVHGRTNRESAEVLSCREGTVELHVHGLLNRCGAENRVMLTALFWSDDTHG